MGRPAGTWGGRRGLGAAGGAAEQFPLTAGSRSVCGAETELGLRDPERRILLRIHPSGGHCHYANDKTQTYCGSTARWVHWTAGNSFLMAYQTQALALTLKLIKMYILKHSIFKK